MDFFLEAFRGIESYSHLWLIFEFHKVEEKNFSALVRPPRFEGKKKLGVYATRSPHRPNRLGLSVVEFDRVESTESEVVLWVRGVDLVSGTPILDIKPYVPYADSVGHAKADLFEAKPSSKEIVWSYEEAGPSDSEKVLIQKVIALDPRPGYESDSLDEFGVSVAGWNVRFRLEGERFLITSVTKV